MMAFAQGLLAVALFLLFIAAGLVAVMLVFLFQMAFGRVDPAGHVPDEHETQAI